MPSSATASTARLQLILGAILFSTGGAAIKASSFSGLQVAGLRSGIAVLCVLVLIPESRTLGTWRTWLVGAAYAATMLLFVSANKLTTAANATFLQATAPVFILLLGPLVLKERVRRRDAAFLAVMLAGLSLFFAGVEAPAASAPNPLLGNALAMVSAVGWALTIVGLRWLGRGAHGAGSSSGAAVIAGNGITFLVGLPWVLAAGETTPRDWLSVAYLGVFQVGLAYVFITRGMRRVPALEASLFLMVEPVLSPIWAYWLHAERPAGWSLLGGAIILAATIAQALTARVEREPPAAA